MNLPKKGSDKIIIKRCSSIIEAVNSGTQLSVLRNEYSFSVLSVVVSELIIKFQNSLNITEKMNNEQIMDCAELIISEYWGFKIEEIQLFFKGAMIGKYGKIYNRIDSMIIFEMLAEYDKQREQELIRQHQKQKTKEPEIFKGVEMPEEVKEKISKFKKGVSISEKLSDEEFRRFKAEEHLKFMKEKGESKR